MKSKYFPYLLITPVIVVLGSITVYPFLYALYLSFGKHSLVLPTYKGQFIGIENYKNVLVDPRFWSSLRITSIFMGSALSIEMLFGLGVALLLSSKPARKIKFILALYIMPMIVTPTVVGLGWSFIYNSEFGIFPWVLDKLALLPTASLLGSTTWALPSLILVDIWEWTPFVSLILLAGLLSFPREPYEAAKVDGASSLQMFTYITLPLLKRAILIAFVLRAIEVFKIFDQIYILTNGGPAMSTEVLPFYAYKVNFAYFNMGYGAALVLIMLLIIIGICQLSVRLLRPKES